MARARLRAALIGCGRIGAATAAALRQRLPAGWLPLAHAEAIRSLPQLDLAALCDVDADRVAAAGRRYGVERLYTDYRELLDKERPEILAIATRTRGRCEIIVEAVKRGVRGLHVEKPLARSVAECRRALAAVVESRVALTYGTTRRFMPAYRVARDVVRSGAIGDPIQIVVEHGRGSLLWSHPHSADLLLFFSGSTGVDYVQATCAIAPEAVRGDEVDTDPVVEHAFVKFANGAAGLITATPGMSTRVAGTRGMVVVEADGRRATVSTKAAPDSPYHDAGTPLTPLPPTPSGTQQALTELAAAVMGGRAVSITAEEIAVGQHVLLACALSSLRGGRRVALSEVPDDFCVTGRTEGLYA